MYVTLSRLVRAVALLSLVAFLFYSIRHGDVFASFLALLVAWCVVDDLRVGWAKQ